MRQPEVASRFRDGAGGGFPSERSFPSTTIAELTRPVSGKHSAQFSEPEIAKFGGGDDQMYP
jgi:hypothetical protein